MEITEVFEQVKAAVQKRLGITPFEVQLQAARALCRGELVQMQTGEGKTLCAVFAACAEAKNGEQTHILTFNDYLARRDYEWMLPVYEELGVSVGCITENTPKSERGEIYSRDVVYVTAKEAGFDYLRGFALFDEKPYFPEKLNFAVFDEADSILIDEARIPLVIAGDYAVRGEGLPDGFYKQSEELSEDCFEIDPESRNVYLTDKGADKAEELFGCDLYAAGNEEILSRLCACLKARAVLKEENDYIVRDGEIVIIDEFTGRAAPGRVFPGDLQAAVEAKHGLKISKRGRIMGNIALQYYARLYPKLAGMTGTAEQAREEFEKFYGLRVCKIPTRLPVARVDKPLELYYDQEEKRAAILSAIKEAHEVGRPVLVGSESIEESESIARDLLDMGIKCAVLNAKNDAEEAAIIARAGERGAVTVSTNMAGRGIDIKLGGADSSDSQDKKFVINAGGLLVLATSPRSTRITDQLRGRAGRQGDPGESRAFAALDDEIYKTHDLKGLAGRHYPKERFAGAAEDKTLLREAERVNRMAENAAFSERELLMKYTMIGEKHRAVTFERRNSLLDGSYNSEFWQKDPRYPEAVKRFGESGLQALQNRVLAALLNEFWSDYLDYTAYLREGIHLTQIAGRNPAEEFNIACEEYYESAAESIPERMSEKLSPLPECGSLSEYTINAPTRVYTYLLNDVGEEFKAKPLLMGLLSDDYETAAEEAFEKPDNSDSSENSDNSEAKPRKGFFGRLFGKK